MSDSLELLALRKEVLVARSALHRLRIRAQLHAMHEGRLGRTVEFLARVLPLFKLASVAFYLFRKFRNQKS